jgi:rhombotail lipoprotein
LITALAIGLIVMGSAACAPRQTVVRTNTLQFLYPAGSAGTTPGAVSLRVPVRVGLAFAPAGEATIGHPISEEQRQQLLRKIADAFRQKEFISSIEAIPSTYLVPGGGFENLDRVKTAFGIDLITLVSFEQVRFTATSGAPSPTGR